MNYEKLYNNIILRAKNRPDTVGYFEIHHILPRCLGGNNSKENLVRLTAKEHFLCHYLLYKMQAPATPAYYKMIYAFKMMKAQQPGTDRYFNARLYESARTVFAEAMSAARIGKTHSEETKQKLRAAATGKTQSEEMKQKMSVYWTDRPQSEETKRKRSKALTGRTLSEGAKQKLRDRIVSEETKQKLRDTFARFPLLTCPHCGMQSKSQSNLNRWHFDNCKKVKF
jgi:hypothetical protein